MITMLGHRSAGRPLAELRLRLALRGGRETAHSNATRCRRNPLIRPTI